MNLSKAATRLSTAEAVRDVESPVFTTRQIALLRNASLSATSQALGRMATRGLIRRVMRGIWYIPNDPRFSVHTLVPVLAGAHRAYVSFISALHLQGLIAQIPEVVFAATTGPTREKQTSVGTYSYHQINPQFFIGFDWYKGAQNFLIASPEKALVDSLYISSRKGKRFRHFPELDLSEGFSFDLATGWAERIAHDWTRQYVLRQLEILQESNAGINTRF